MAIDLPEGFELDPTELPQGFQVDSQNIEQPSQPEINQPLMGRGEAAFTMATNPLGFGDEIKAALAAGLAKTFGGKLTADIDIGDLYKEARDNERNKQQQARTQYPVQSFAAQMFSDVGVAGKMLSGANLAGQGFKTAVKGGALLGGASALGETKDITDVPQVAKDVGAGVALGGVAGGALNKALPAVASAAGAVSQLPKKLLQKAAGVTPKSQETIRAFEQAGINPTLANVTEGQTTKTFQNLLGNFPGSRGEIEKATQGQIDDITKQIAGITKSEGGTIQETGKKIQQGAVNVKSAIEGRIKQNYDELDKFIPKEGLKLYRGEYNRPQSVEKGVLSTSKNPDVAKGFSESGNIKEFFLNPNAKIVDISKLRKEILGVDTLPNPNTLSKKQFASITGEALVKRARELGYDAIDQSSIGFKSRGIRSTNKLLDEEELKIINPSVLNEGGYKIPTNNLQALKDDPYIQDVVGVNNADTQRVIQHFSNLVDEKGAISYPRLKIFRSTVGAKLQSASLGGDERAALKKIYGALSEDMKSAVVGNGGEKGLQAFNKANKSFARYQDVLESRINPLIEAKTPEAVYSMAMSGTKQGGSNIRGIMKTLDPEQKQFVQGTITKRMGLANAGQQGAEGETFSPAKFLTEWNKLSPEAKTNIYDKGQVGAINNLNKVIETIKETSKARQSSNNLPYAAWIGLGSLSLANLPAGVAAVGGAKITAKMMTNPRFINWLANSAKVKPAQIPAHLSQLSKIAAANPDIREGTLDFIQSITQDSQAKEPTQQDIDQLRERYKQAVPITKYMPDDQELKRIIR